MVKQAPINSFKEVSKAAKDILVQAKANPALFEEFNSIFKEAAAAVANTQDSVWLDKEKKKTRKISDEISLDKVDRASLAQLNQGVVGNVANTPAKELNVVPLQVFLDNTLRALEKVSKQEFRVNDLINKYIEGEVSEDEVVLETAKLNLSISMVTTIVQSAVQTFKEIQNIPV